MAKHAQTSLTKQDAINMLREKHGLTAEKAREIFEDLVQAMSDSVVETGYLSIKDFITLTVVERAGRTVNHPASQEPVKIKPRKGVRVALARKFKDRVVRKGKLPVAA